MDYSSRPDVTSKSQAIQLIWDRLFPKLLYLFKDGDQCLSVTGGWTVIKDTTYQVASLTESYINMNTIGHTNNHDTNRVQTNKKIDFSYYTTLYVDMEITTLNTGGRADTFDIMLDGDNSFILWRASKTLTRGIISIDIAAIIGYRALTVRPNSWQSANSNVVAKIYNIWLE